jgi:hypothetical protein
LWQSGCCTYRYAIRLAAAWAAVDADLRHDRDSLLALVGVEHEVEVGVGAAQILACGHNDDLLTAAGACRFDSVAHGSLLSDWVSETSSYAFRGSLSRCLNDPLTRSPFLLLEEHGAELAEPFGAVDEDLEQVPAVPDGQGEHCGFAVVGGLEPFGGVLDAGLRSLAARVRTSLSSTGTPARNVLRAYTCSLRRISV